MRDENDSPTSDDRGHDRSGVADDRLRLLFTCCHPALALDARVALTLRAVGGLEVAEVARGFLTTETTMYQRLVRAKRKVKAAGIPYRVPADDELPERLGGVLHVLHLVYTEGHVATAGDELVRADLCEEAIRLARLVVELLPSAAEAHGLLALLLLTDARRPARTDADGTPISLEDQDRSRWDRDAIAEGTAVLDHALDASAARPVPGAGGRRRAPRRSPVVGRHRLAPDRRALRRARAARPVAGRHAQPGRGARARRRPPRRPRAARGASTTTTGSTATSRCTPPGPSSSPEPATSTAPPPPTDERSTSPRTQPSGVRSNARAARWGCWAT